MRSSESSLSFCLYFISCCFDRVISLLPLMFWHFLRPWIYQNRVRLLEEQYRTGMKGATVSVLTAVRYLLLLLWSCFPFSPYPFNLFILAACAARTVLLYSNCILSIKKACFPWLLWCWNGSRGAIHIHSAVCFLPPLFCANSRIPIYILAVELNYCKHLCGPARHNRLARSCIMSVPPTGHDKKCTIVHSGHVWHQGLLKTQWNGVPDSSQGRWNNWEMNPFWLRFLCQCTVMCAFCTRN